MKHTSCTILRTFVRTSGTVDLNTGKYTDRGSETVTEPCAVPLSNHREIERGICRSCAQGWSVEANKFATTVEYERATGNKS